MQVKKEGRDAGEERRLFVAEFIKQNIGSIHETSFTISASVNESDDYDQNLILLSPSECNISDLTCHYDVDGGLLHAKRAVARPVARRTQPGGRHLGCEPLLGLVGLARALLRLLQQLTGHALAEVGEHYRWMLGFSLSGALSTADHRSLMAFQSCLAITGVDLGPSKMKSAPLCLACSSSPSPMEGRRLSILGMRTR
ncbi:unnamed protein product [Leptidea sinapis]|uniref:Uncharacterized protein n=1 Tax=Leptidea sinapis TaxID=189913 RepID=A0A5E4QSA5_9NEOP|nr:unnamed protein product [Leptidea sinapis]